jgi:short-subunit dehydrogenase
MTMTNKPYKAVLTGATGGIGRAIALQLAPQCSSLILMGRDTQKLEALKNELSNTAANIQIVSGDLCDDSTSVRLMDAISAQQGINLLINNAGISQFKSFEQQSDKDITQLMLTNLISPMLLCKQLLPLLKKEPSQIINIGSIFGYLGFPGFSSYCASKFGTIECVYARINFKDHLLIFISIFFLNDAQQGAIVRANNSTVTSWVRVFGS